MPEAFNTVVLAFALGLCLGIFGRWSRFCTLGALSDQFLLYDGRRLRMWMFAGATAVLGTQVLIEFYGLNLIGTTVTRPGFSWSGTAFGGVTLGAGMALAGGDAFRAVIKLGGGSLRALVILLTIALFAGMAETGMLSGLRRSLETLTYINLAGLGPSSAVPDLMANATGAPRMVVAGILGGGLALFLLTGAFGYARFRRSPRMILGGLVVGGGVAAAWAITGVVGSNAQGLDFILPMAEVLRQLLGDGSTGAFMIALVTGMLFGSFVVALVASDFGIDGFDGGGDLARTLTGAAMMGVGGSMTIGGGIGQGLTGVSTLALGSLLSVIAIVTGAIVALKATGRVPREP